MKATRVRVQLEVTKRMSCAFLMGFVHYAWRKCQACLLAAAQAVATRCVRIASIASSSTWMSASCHPKIMSSLTGSVKKNVACNTCGAL